MQTGRSRGRRSFLTALGTVGAAVVAGCLGTDDAGRSDSETETASDTLCEGNYPTARYDIDPFAFTFVAPAGFSADEVDIRPTFGVFGDFSGTIGDYRLNFSISQSLDPVSEAVVERGMEPGPQIAADRQTFFHDFMEYEGHGLDGFHYRSHDRDDRPYPEIFWIPFTMPSGDVRYLQCEMGLSISFFSWQEAPSDTCLAALDRLRAAFIDSLEPNTDTTAATLF